MITIITLIGFLLIKAIFQNNNNQSEEITGQDIYNDLDLEKVSEISIHSLHHVDQGKLKGEDKWYLLKKSEDKEIINIIIDYIRKSKVKIKKNVMSSYPSINTHYFIFDIDKRLDNVRANYSLKENKLSIRNPHFSNELIKWDGSPFNTKVVIIKLDDEFKEIMKNYP